MKEYGLEITDTEYGGSELDIDQFIETNTLGSQIETTYKSKIDELKTNFAELTQEKKKLQNEGITVTTPSIFRPDTNENMIRNMSGGGMWQQGGFFMTCS